MGTLLQPNLQKRHMLDARVLIGRSRKCDLRLVHPSISGEHALIWWDGEHWRIRDLGSRNGTRVGGDTVGTEQSRTLTAGDALSFGRYPVRWTMESTAPPSARAVPQEGEPVVAEDDMLALPSPETPAVLIYADPLQGWVLESGDEMRPAVDQEILTIEGVVWRLHLPDILTSTVDLSAGTATLSALSLTFSISADEEHVHLAASDGTTRHDLGARVHNYTLLTLARRRLCDAEDPELSPEAQGWMYRDDLARMLQLSRTHLNLYIFRIRKQLAALKIQDADSIIERRSDTQQLRIGSVRLSIQTV